MKGAKAVVIGAGSIGVESAISLKRRGMKVTLLEMLGHVLPTAFDEEAASIIKRRIEDLGIGVLTGEKAVRFTGNGHVQSVITDTREIPCDMVVLSVGVKPAIELAVQMGSEAGPYGGIKIDSHMKTTLPDIYAAGDVAETHDIARGTPFINAIWPCAFEQGTIAGLNMAGKETPYEGSFRRNSIGNFIGIPAISMGLTYANACTDCAEGDRFQEIKEEDKEHLSKAHSEKRPDHWSDPCGSDPEGRALGHPAEEEDRRLRFHSCSDERQPQFPRHSASLETECG